MEKSYACDICGEPMKEDDTAEMHDPQDGAGSLLCHPQCGLNNGMEVS